MLTSVTDEGGVLASLSRAGNTTAIGSMKSAVTTAICAWGGGIGNEREVVHRCLCVCVVILFILDAHLRAIADPRGWLVTQEDGRKEGQHATFLRSVHNRYDGRKVVWLMAVLVVSTGISPSSR